jgi:phospholipid/cholesterol/gamma-HCH transport system ATP-binding protein
MQPAEGMNEAPTPSCIEVTNLTLAHNGLVVLRNLNFTVLREDIFIIMGASGCGKSTLLRAIMGLHAPAFGTVRYGKTDFWRCGEDERQDLLRNIGVLFQGGALWTSMTLAENVALPLSLHTTLNEREIYEQACLKLALVGLTGFEEYYPSEISGGMRKRAGLARALALDPHMLFFDEPSAGLDPIAARNLDDLILELRQSLKMTFVVVTHDLASIFAIGGKAVFLDRRTRSAEVCGAPKDLLNGACPAQIRNFLTRGSVEGGRGHAP